MKHIVYLLTILFFASACEKIDIETYNGDNYIQFVDSYNDSTSLTFIFFPNQSNIEYPLKIRVLGAIPDKDLSYKLRVVKEETTAPENCYDIPEGQVFPQGEIAGVAQISFVKQPEMDSIAYRIVVELIGTEDIGTGASLHCRKIFWISNTISQPEWWDSNIVSYYLGKYSTLKFSKFIEVTGSGDLTNASIEERRKACLQFKYYLLQQKEAGTPVLEADGSKMTVPIKG